MDMVEDMLDQALDDREEISMAFFKKLHESIGENVVPNMLKDCQYYCDRKRDNDLSRMFE